METPNATVDYSDGENETPSEYASLNAKIEKALDITKQALEQYDNPAIMWTGGKDSTLTLYFALEVADKYGYEKPDVVFIDHGQHFDSIHNFVKHWADQWNLTLHIARNDGVIDVAGDPGDDVAVADLDDDNTLEVRERLDYDDDTFPFLLDTYVGNHLLKTVALNETLLMQDIDGVISGVRWDEQEARADETFFSPRHDMTKYPPHDRVHPILQFTEADLWEVTWNHLVPDIVSEYPDDGYVPQALDDIPGTLDPDAVPVSPKYFKGYRSLGSETSTQKTTDDPAWLQDMDNTTERAGRAQDKEDLMERLRDLGYM